MAIFEDRIADKCDWCGKKIGKLGPYRAWDWQVCRDCWVDLESDAQPKHPREGKTMRKKARGEK